MNLNNKVIIIDEAHNIAQAAEDIIEFELSITDLDSIIEDELLKLLRFIDHLAFWETVSVMFPNKNFRETIK